LAAGNFWDAPNVYAGSTGLFELFYQKIMFFLPDFSVYYIYYISIGINILCGLLIFILALNLFKNRIVAHISFLIFAFYSVLIKTSATDIFYIIDTLTLLLFLNFLLFTFQEKRNHIWPYILLFFLFCANLVGRIEYLAFFTFGSFLYLFFFIVIHKRRVKEILANKRFLFFAAGTFAVSIFYFIFSILPEINTAAQQVSTREVEEVSRYIKNSFSFWSDTGLSFGFFLNDFFTPWYFTILLFILPFVMLWKKQWSLVFIDLLFILCLLPLIQTMFCNLRIVIPFLFFLIPQLAYAMYWVFSVFKIKPMIILFLSFLVIAGSFPQNKGFLTIETARKKEQDFLIKHLQETIPPDSLILTVAQKKYRDSKFDQVRDYKYRQHGLEFPSYLIPDDKDIDVMDVYREYGDNKDTLDEYKNVFYYKGLYSYHEGDRAHFAIDHRYLQNPDSLDAPEAVSAFENDHKTQITPIEEKMVENFGYQIKTVNDFLEKRTLDINAAGDLKIGLYSFDDHE
jgi:hypothetical protein